jgi:hypothetical protein
MLNRHHLGTGRKRRTRGVLQPRVEEWWTILDLNQ